MFLPLALTHSSAKALTTSCIPGLPSINRTRSHTPLGQTRSYRLRLALIGATPRGQYFGFARIGDDSSISMHIGSLPAGHGGGDGSGSGFLSSLPFSRPGGSIVGSGTGGGGGCGSLSLLS